MHDYVDEGHWGIRPLPRAPDPAAEVEHRARAERDALDHPLSAVMLFRPQPAIADQLVNASSRFLSRAASISTRSQTERRGGTFVSVRDVTERPVRDVTERPRIVGIHQTAELAVHPDVNAHVLLECPLSVNHDRFSHKLFDNILKSLELLGYPGSQSSSRAAVSPPFACQARGSGTSHGEAGPGRGRVRLPHGRVTGYFFASEGGFDT